MEGKRGLAQKAWAGLKPGFESIFCTNQKIELWNF